MNGFTTILRMLLMNNLYSNNITKQILTYENRFILFMKKSYLWKQGGSCQTHIQATPCLDKSINNK